MPPQPSADEQRELFQKLAPGDRVEIEHEVKVGFRHWRTKTVGQVVRIERRRHGLHDKRNFDDKVFSDLIVLRRTDGELTTVTLDDFSILRKLDETSATSPAPESNPHGPVVIPGNL